MEIAEEDGDTVSDSLAEKDLNKPMQLCFGAFHERQIPIVKGPMSDSTRKRKIKAMKDLAQELSTRAKVQTIFCIVSPNKKIPTRFLESYGDHADNFLYATESGSKIESILKVATETWIGTSACKQPEKKNQTELSTTTAEDTVTTNAARHAVQIAIEKAEEKRKRLQLIENQRKKKRNRITPEKAKKNSEKSDTFKSKKDHRKHLPNKRSSFQDKEAVSGSKTTLEILETPETNSRELLQESDLEPICRKGKKGSYLPLHVNHFQKSLEKLLDDSETSETPELNHHDFTGSTNSISISPRSPTTFQTDQEPLSPVFSSVFNAEVAESESSGVLQTAQHLGPEAATTGSEIIMIAKIPDVVNARNEQKEGHTTAQEREPNQEASSILPIPVGRGKRLEAKWHTLFSNNEYSPPKNCLARTNRTRKRLRICGNEEQNKT